MIRTVFRDRAKSDVESAANYYDLEGGLVRSQRFLDAIRAAVVLLDDHPKAGSLGIGQDIVQPGLRSWPIKGFPFQLIYLVTKSRTEGYRVLHSSRDIPASLR